MRWREFVALLGAAALWPLVACAQEPCGSVGVRVHPMTAAFAKSLGMVEPYGAIFGRPRPGGPAAMAGIEPYDVVTAINGTPLHSWREFAPTIAKMAPNTVISLTTWRSRQLIDVRVVVGAASCPSVAKHR